MPCPKNIHTRNVIKKKYSCGSKIPHPHHGPSLRQLISGGHLTVPWGWPTKRGRWRYGAIKIMIIMMIMFGRLTLLPRPSCRIPVSSHMWRCTQNRNVYCCKSDTRSFVPLCKTTCWEHVSYIFTITAKIEIHLPSSGSCLRFGLRGALKQTKIGNVLNPVSNWWLISRKVKNSDLCKLFYNDNKTV